MAEAITPVSLSGAASVQDYLHLIQINSNYMYTVPLTTTQSPSIISHSCPATLYLVQFTGSINVVTSAPAIYYGANNLVIAKVGSSISPGYAATLNISSTNFSFVYTYGSNTLYANGSAIIVGLVNI